MQLTKAETKKAVSLLPSELTVIRVQHDHGFYNITVGDKLSEYFDYGIELDEAHAGDETVVDPDEPTSGEDWLEDIIASCLIWANGSLEFKRDYCISRADTIAYLNTGEITLTQAGVDRWLRKEGWQPRKHGTQALIARVQPAFPE